MKKLRGLLCVALILALSLTAFGCSTANSPTSAEKAFSSVRDVYAFSAVSGAELLGQTSGISAKLSRNHGGFGGGELPGDMTGSGEMTGGFGQGPVKEDILEKNVDQINKYLNMFEDMLTDSSPIETTVTQDAVYNEVTYQVKMTVATKGLDGATTQYDFYYNEYKVDESGNDETDQNGELVEVTEEEFETETRSRLEGVIVMGELTYTVTGERKTEIEVDDGETETEVTTKFTATDTVGNSICVEQKIEEEEGESEQSFTYTVKDAEGKLVSSDKIKMESEEGEIKVKLVTIADGVKTEYEFKRDGDKISIRYTDESGMRVKATVKVVVDENGATTYEYIFVNGNKAHKGRH